MYACTTSKWYSGSHPLFATASTSLMDTDGGRSSTSLMDADDGQGEDEWV